MLTKRLFCCAASLAVAVLGPARSGAADLKVSPTAVSGDAGQASFSSQVGFPVATTAGKAVPRGNSTPTDRGSKPLTMPSGGDKTGGPAGLGPAGPDGKVTSPGGGPATPPPGGHLYGPGSSGKK
jgi:hypothetical protein